MKSDIDHVRAAGVQPEQLAVGHVREPGQRMPIIRVTVHERPFDARPGQSFPDHRILIDVTVVVVSHEIVMPRGPIDGQRGEDQEQAGPEGRPSAGSGNAHGTILERKGAMPRKKTPNIEHRTKRTGTGESRENRGGNNRRGERQRPGPSFRKKWCLGVAGLNEGKRAKRNCLEGSNGTALLGNSRFRLNERFGLFGRDFMVHLALV